MNRVHGFKIFEHEDRVKSLEAEKRMLADSQAKSEQEFAALHAQYQREVQDRAEDKHQYQRRLLRERDKRDAEMYSFKSTKEAEIDSLKRSLDWMQSEVSRLTEMNKRLTNTNEDLTRQYLGRIEIFENQLAQASRELAETRNTHANLWSGIEENVRDEDYFDNAFQQLYQYIQEWVLNFSRASDTYARLTSQINNGKITDKLSNAILDGSDVNIYLADRVERWKVLMSVIATDIWGSIFTEYLFGLDLPQRKQLEALEKTLSMVGPTATVRTWRATTLNLMSKDEKFQRDRQQRTSAVVRGILYILSKILQPLEELEVQLEERLVKVVEFAVALSIDMRCQRAEYMVLPPLLPDRNAKGDVVSRVDFNAAIMNERSGVATSNEALEAEKAVVRIVLFPLVVRKGNDSGDEDGKFVIYPAQVLCRETGVLS